VRCWHESSDALIVTLIAARPTISPAVLDGFERAIALAESDFQMLVIESQQNFAYGADLDAAFDAVAAGRPDVLDRALDRYQRTMLALRHAAIPTIAVTRGVAISGGCEVLMHCTRVVAAPTSPIGLVETSVGVLPGGGGVKEMARRAMLSTDGGDLYPALERAFKVLAAAQIVRARDAKALNLLTENDVVDDGDLLAIAKELGRSLQRDGYRPPPRNPTIRVGGADALERLLESGRGDGGSGLTAHQLRINAHVAEVLCGGGGPARDVSEQTLLDLERSHFIALAQTHETQARLEHLRATGTVLRN
jgi:3-hydroxyacyl-CoA dehydrogenase